MSKFPVSIEKEKLLQERMHELEIFEDELVEKFIRGSGSGGQKINKTSSCVYLSHKKSGIEIKCQRVRSQALNRYYARVELCDKVEEQVKGIASKKQQEIEKIRRQKKRRTRKQKEKMLAEKKKQSEIKTQRKAVREEDT